MFRLRGYEEEWLQTRERRVDYHALPAGNYAFELRAIDRDLNYSPPISVPLVVHPPYSQWALWLGLGLACSGLAVTFIIALRRHRSFLYEQATRLQTQEQFNQALEESNAVIEEGLQTAHEMQMGLMPTESPQIDGGRLTCFDPLRVRLFGSLKILPG